MIWPEECIFTQPRLWEFLTASNCRALSKGCATTKTGASLSSFVADLFKLDDNDRKKDCHLRPQRRICAVLGTPFSGAIFGVEVLYVGSLLYEDLLPSIIAGITSYQIASLLGIRYQFFRWRLK